MPAALSKPFVKRHFPKRFRAAHKGDFGRVLILAGSRGMVGAGVLASQGALRIGAGLIRFGTVKSQQVVAAKRAPLEITTLALKESSSGTLSSQAIGEIRKVLKSFDPTVILVGPGLGVGLGPQKVVRFLVGLPFPLVLDADALNAWAKMKLKPKKGQRILTPHPGEAGRLLGRSTVWVQAHREESVVRLARQTKSVVILKGAGSLISDGKKVLRNPTGNPGLASGGTGDVLAGMVSGLWGQFSKVDKQSACLAAGIAAYVHGAAGDRAARQKGQASLTASDVVDCIAPVLKAALRG